MQKEILAVLTVVLFGGQALAAPTVSQQQAMTARAKAFTGKPCATFTMYQEMPLADAAAFKAGLQAMLAFQKGHGIKSLKQAQSATEFREYAQQGSKQQFIYHAMSGGKTITASCILK